MRAWWNRLLDYKDAPFALDYLYAASESPDWMARGLEALVTHLVMDANVQCPPPSL